MKIKFPTRYKIVYPDKNLKYYNSYGQAKIKKLLTNASSGYCMYCGNKILINNRNMGQIEHSIEKKQREIQFEYLTHCKYNMAIACAPCNVKFKKIIYYQLILKQIINVLKVALICVRSI